ncbi:hypothetical protein [Mucilaginibacter sp.]|uniref:hypothetical protein n=1 Tax=Mucilaginibacter sp. TaxID=1882438 RepID=UPI00284DD03E|nr:hypothetical protein [Mucilaginibacter sp.]MDR3695749.1 hypothetical protein [Mucilaginibacter sp.]
MQNWKRDMARLMSVNKQSLNELAEMSKAMSRKLSHGSKRFSPDTLLNELPQKRSNEVLFDRAKEKMQFEDRMNKLREISNRLKQINY